MNATLLLADYAQVGPDQKLHAIGLGWSKTTTPLAAHSVILMIEFEPTAESESHDFTLRLADDQGITVTDPKGAEINIRGSLAPSDAAPQDPLAAHIVVTMSPGLPLKPGAYKWELTVTPFEGKAWTRRFLVSEPAQDQL